MKLISLLSALLVIFPACVFSEPLNLSEKDSGKEMSVSLNQEIIITIPENPTTGYSWQFETEPAQQNYISDIEENYIVPNTNLVGAGGKKQIKFKTLNSGTIKIEGFYIRPWEKDIEPASYVSYTFKIL